MRPPQIHHAICHLSQLVSIASRSTPLGQQQLPTSSGHLHKLGLQICYAIAQQNWPCPLSLPAELLSAHPNRHAQQIWVRFRLSHAAPIASASALAATLEARAASPHGTASSFFVKLLPGFQLGNIRKGKMNSQQVVCTPEPDGIAGSDRIREGCSLGLLWFDLVTDRSPSFDIHQQFGTPSLPNFVENFEFEFDIEFVVLAQFGTESPSCSGVDSFYHPN
ncbi:hypothetical protein Taro_033149 [Colocasia esculenta]|uniref:Uncharacterized protein n=1 Tax=Colocasia esculenta TaxID=4460 RepID=A0A843VUJ4_COLES|nr:hypothetical protein [Colocasia esculenta]